MNETIHTIISMALPKAGLAVLFGCLISLAVLSDAQTGPPASAKPIKGIIHYVPLASCNGPLIPIMLTNKIKGTFFVDTGTNVSMLSAEIVAKLGLKPVPAVKNGHPFLVDGKQWRMVTLPHLQIGPFQGSQLTFLVVPARYLTSVLHAPVDGLMGCDKLKYCAMEIDAVRHHLILWSPGHLSSADLAAAGFANVTPSRLTYSKAGLYLAQTRISTGRASAMQPLAVDSGASGTTIPRNLVLHLHLKSQPFAAPARTFGGQIQVNAVIVPILSLSSLKLNQYPVASPADRNSPLPISLGMDILAAHLTLIDFAAREIYIRPDPVSQRGRK